MCGTIHPLPVRALIALARTRLSLLSFHIPRFDNRDLTPGKDTQRPGRLCGVPSLPNRHRWHILTVKMWQCVKVIPTL
jgi:hypothetical protein